MTRLLHWWLALLENKSPIEAALLTIVLVAAIVVAVIVLAPARTVPHRFTAKPISRRGALAASSRGGWREGLRQRRSPVRHRRSVPDRRGVADLFRSCRGDRCVANDGNERTDVVNDVVLPGGGGSIYQISTPTTPAMSTVVPHSMASHCT